MSWYLGPTVAEALATLPLPPPLTALPTRMPIQDVYKFDTRRIFAGREDDERALICALLNDGQLTLKRQPGVAQLAA